MVGRFPMCALFLEVPVEQVDVNVHPNKLEVRFQNEPAVADAVRTLVAEAMRGETLARKAGGGAGGTFRRGAQSRFFAGSAGQSPRWAGDAPGAGGRPRKAARDLRRTPNRSLGTRC